jgi:hypothetical protein
MTRGPKLELLGKHAVDEAQIREEQIMVAGSASCILRRFLAKYSRLGFYQRIVEPGS